MKLARSFKNIASVVAVLCWVFIALVATLPISALAAPGDVGGDCKHLEEQFHTVNGGEPAFTDPHTLDQTFPKYCTAAAVIDKATTIIFSLSGAAAVLFIVIGGFMFMTSAGNQEQAEKGRKTLIYAIGGLVVIVLASAIVKVVVNLIAS